MPTFEGSSPSLSTTALDTREVAGKGKRSRRTYRPAVLSVPWPSPSLLEGVYLRDPEAAERLLERAEAEDAQANRLDFSRLDAGQLDPEDHELAELAVHKRRQSAHATLERLRLTCGVTGRQRIRLLERGARERGRNPYIAASEKAPDRAADAGPHLPAGTPRPRGAGRPRAQATRSSVRAGSSGSDDGPGGSSEPALAPAKTAGVVR